jgi:mRNA degradation ribonuclease J1/J2
MSRIPLEVIPSRLRMQGAVMFLLEGPCGRILHTGDFR